MRSLASSIIIHSFSFLPMPRTVRIKIAPRKSHLEVILGIPEISMPGTPGCRTQGVLLAAALSRCSSRRHIGSTFSTVPSFPFRGFTDSQ
jgi:hypothetical protein